jgi:hypothetical protein
MNNSFLAIKTYILVTPQQMAGPFVVMILTHGKKNVTFFSDSSKIFNKRQSHNMVIIVRSQNKLNNEYH